MFNHIIQVIHDLWQQPAAINLNYALPWLLVVVIIGVLFLPIPVETLIFTSLTLAKHWHYSLITLLSIFIAGTWVALQMSYCFGYWLEHLLEPWLLRRMKISPHDWHIKLNNFKRFHILILSFGLFVPGFRHLVGVLAGATQMRYALFAVLALVGSILWVGTFTILGWLIG